MAKQHGTSKLLGEVVVCGIPCEVWESCAKDDPKLDGNYGYCEPEAQKIVVEAGLKPETFRETLVHEVRHMIWALGGIRYFVANYFGVTPGGEKVAEFEEIFLRLETHELLSVFGQFKKLKP